MTFFAAVGDVNGDGRPDVVAANYCSNNFTLHCYNGTVTVMLGNGDGTLQGPVSYTLNELEAEAVAIADVNGDGNEDLVVSNGSNSVGILLGNGDGTFRSETSYSVGGYEINSLIVADVNGDGIPDISAATLCGTSSTCYGHQSMGTVDVLLGNGDGTFQPFQTFSPGGFGTYFIAFGDANGDGKADLFAVNECADATCLNGTVGVLINTSTLPTSISLISSVNPSTYLQTVKFTATVSHQSGKSIPTGTVTFFDGSKVVGKAKLNAKGLVAVSTNALTIGNHNLSATYNGDANYTSSTSTVLSQVVLGPVAEVSPTSLTFATQVVFTTSIPQTVTVTNSGAGALVISKVAIAGAFGETNNCSSLSAGASCTIAVTFTPTTSGGLGGTLYVTDNAQPGTQRVTLKGIGTDIQLNPTSLSFGNQTVGTASEPQTITLTNKGTVTVSMGKISVTGTNALDFSSTNTCGSSVGPGASCSVNVTFTPSAKGARSANLSVADSGGGSPQTAGLSGSGT